MKVLEDEIDHMKDEHSNGVYLPICNPRWMSWTSSTAVMA
jgi:hypothetical protein